jgi:hypothetical protein
MIKTVKNEINVLKRIFEKKTFYFAGCAETVGGGGALCAGF